MKLLMDKTERIVTSSDNELVDLMRAHINYVRPDGVFDQLQKGGKLTLICLILLGNFLIMLVSAMSGLM